jgi:hypothetical protein
MTHRDESKERFAVRLMRRRHLDTRRMRGVVSQAQVQVSVLGSWNQHAIARETGFEMNAGGSIRVGGHGLEEIELATRQ